MSEHPFSQGKLQYWSEIIDADALCSLLQEFWMDGYVAFSNKELRWSEISGRKARELCMGKVSGIPEVEGFLMEAGLWRHKDNRFEEISIERDGDEFVLERWSLDAECPEEEANCFFSRSSTVPRRPGTLFSGNALETLEVIVPEQRLHFYLTTGESTNGPVR